MPFEAPSGAVILELIEHIYDAAIEPTRWEPLLARLKAIYDGEQMVIAVNQPQRKTISFLATYNENKAFSAAMQANVASNPANAAVPYMEIGVPYSVYALINMEEVRRGRWYGRTMEPYGVGDVAAILLTRTNAEFGSFNILRRSDQPAFGPAELNSLAILAPHIRRAVMIANMLDAQALERKMLAATLDRMAVGIVLTDASGRVVHANEAALRHMEVGSAILRQGDMLSARSPAAADDLARSIVSAALGTTVDIPKSGVVVALPATEGADLAAWVLPLDGGLRADLGAGFDGRAAIFIREMGDTSPFPAELFVRRYGITPSECRILMLLVQGMKIAEAADEIGISLATAKTHLSQLFAKTGSRGQTDLVRLAMSALAPTAT